MDGFLLPDERAQALEHDVDVADGCFEIEHRRERGLVEESADLLIVADECEMSRSCQSGTFSSPTCAAARTTRARPEIRSATFGFRLCGIADDPFIPAANGSSTSRTSVRARWRISTAKRSSDEAQTAR